MYDKELGELVDLDQAEFEAMVSTYNLGDVKNLILVLENTYYLLRNQKDAVIDHVVAGRLPYNDPQVASALNGLYAEMTKIELKVTHLKARVGELSKVWKSVVDTNV